MALYHRGPGARSGGRAGGTGASIRIPIYVLMLMHFASRSCSLAPSSRLLARRPLRAVQTAFTHRIITIWQVKFAQKERKSTKKRTFAKQKKERQSFYFDFSVLAFLYPFFAQTLYLVAFCSISLFAARFPFSCRIFSSFASDSVLFNRFTC